MNLRPTFHMEISHLNEFSIEVFNNQHAVLNSVCHTFIAFKPFNIKMAELYCMLMPLQLAGRFETFSLTTIKCFFANGVFESY